MTPRLLVLSASHGRLRSGSGDAAEERPAARGAVAARRLDLHDVRAEIAEDLAGQRAGLVAAIENANVGEQSGPPRRSRDSNTPSDSLGSPGMRVQQLFDLSGPHGPRDGRRPRHRPPPRARPRRGRRRRVRRLAQARRAARRPPPPCAPSAGAASPSSATSRSPSRSRGWWSACSPRRRGSTCSSTTPASCGGRPPSSTRSRAGTRSSRVNVRGLWLLSQRVARHMRDAGRRLDHPRQLDLGHGRRLGAGDAGDRLQRQQGRRADAHQGHGGQARALRHPRERDRAGARSSPT